VSKKVYGSQEYQSTLSGAYAMSIHQAPPDSCGSALFDEPDPNTEAVVELACPDAETVNVLGAIYWSYKDLDESVSGGSIGVFSGGSVPVMGLDVVTGGPGYLPFVPPWPFEAGSSIVVRLADAGPTVTGRLKIHAWSE